MYSEGFWYPKLDVLANDIVSAGLRVGGVKLTLLGTKLMELG